MKIQQFDLSVRDLVASCQDDGEGVVDVKRTICCESRGTADRKDYWREPCT